ncbi:MAG: molecular chaperone SurA [Sedimenticola sp.]|nr:MAG: molecular chaperone SurA [Sedimenticola sp.]
MTCLLAAHGVNAEVTQVDRIVALINDDIVAQSELDREMKTILIQLQQSNTNLPSMDTLRKQVLERLVLKKLQLAAAAQVGINVGEDVLAQAINNIAKKNNLTLSEFRQALEQQGVSFNSYREDIRSQIILAKLQDQEIRNRIRVTDQEVDVFLTQHAKDSGSRNNYHLSHILVATPEGASPEQLQNAQAKAESIIKRLREGADFKSLAVAESDGNQALEGGDLGWRPANQLPTIFVEQVRDMGVGDISDPIHTPSGFHIIKLNEAEGEQRHIITQTHVRHILINTNEVTSDNDARTRLLQLKMRIENGDDFANLARSHSDDKSTAISGGDLGWTTPGDLFPQFEQVVKELQPNQLSEPFRTDLGWHLVQVMERREHDNTATIQKAEARKAIIKRKMEEESELYLRRLRDEAYVDMRLDDN